MSDCHLSHCSCTNDFASEQCIHWNPSGMIDRLAAKIERMETDLDGSRDRVIELTRAIERAIDISGVPVNPVTSLGRRCFERSLKILKGVIE